MKKTEIGTQLDDLAVTKYGEKFLLNQALTLIEFSGGSRNKDGSFGYLDSFGVVDSSKPRELYIQCRMIQVFGIAHLHGLRDNKEIIEDGINIILDLFQDKTHGGFYNSIDQQGNPVATNKLAYDHMFVLLAACTAKVVGASRADELLRIIDSLIDKYFWDPRFEMMNNSWNLQLDDLSSYRGINANMHAVEALAAAFDVTGDEKYRHRAFVISKKTAEDFARNNNWLLPEHFNQDWVMDKDFNIDNPADPFCPFGVTIGHLFEWSRLLMHVRLQIRDTEYDDGWIAPAATHLYDTARKYGWCADGTDGFVYTINWEKKPVVRSRMFWVAAEAVMTAYTLWEYSGETQYLRDYDYWWKYIDTYVIDKKNGSWFHELDPNQHVVGHTWPGKPDTYHAFNACILPLYPMGTSFIGTVLDARGK